MEDRMNSELFTSLRDRKFPGSPKGVLIFCSFPFVYACVFVCVLMRYRKARGPNKFPFLFCWLIIIIISIFSAIFEPFLSFYRSFSFFSSLVHPNGKKKHISKLQMVFWWRQQLQLDCCSTFWVRQSSGEHFWRQNKVLMWKWWSKSNQLNR